MEFDIIKDPHSTASNDDLKQQYEFLSGVRDKLAETPAAIDRIRDARSQINSMNRRIKDNKEYESIFEMGNVIVERLTAIEMSLYQTRNQSSQDPLKLSVTVD